MTLLSRMQTYETIVSPKGESVAPVEKRLRMINDEIAKLAPNAPPSDPRAEPERERQRVQEPEPEPERSEPVREEPKPSRPMTRQELLEQQTGRERRRPLTRQELREFGRTAMPQEERFYDRTRER